MKIEILMSKLFGFSPQTYFNWKKEEEKRQIIKLLDKYFTKADLEEFLEFGKIKKFEDYKNLSNIEETLNKSLASKIFKTDYQSLYILIYFCNSIDKKFSLDYSFDLDKGFYQRKLSDLKEEFFSFLSKNNFLDFYLENFSDKYLEIFNEIDKAIDGTGIDHPAYEDEFNNIWADYRFKLTSKSEGYSNLIVFLSSLDTIELYYFLVTIEDRFKNDFEKQFELVQRLHGKN
jgi:hypothetical protein